MSNAKTDEPNSVAPDRLKALADGVFAIVMTLLVLELTVPAATEVAHSGGLARVLAEMWPEFLFYGLSFLILGIFWLVHHMIFDVIERSDPTLVWLNIVYLLFAALIPFSTALYGKHSGETISATIYGANQLLVFFMGFSIWSYATGKNRLTTGDVDPALIKGTKMMGYLYFIVLLIAIGLSFVDPLVSTIIYAAFAIIFIALTTFGLADRAVSLQTKRKKDADS